MPEGQATGAAAGQGEVRTEEEAAQRPAGAAKSGRRWEGGAMNTSARNQYRLPHLHKETKRMPKRLSTFATLMAAGLLLLAALPVASATAAEPWWQVLTGSRPSHMWEPGDSMATQEVQAKKFNFFGLAEILAVRVEVAGQVVGCLGAGTLAPLGGPSADQGCESETGFPASETAAEFKEMLEGPYGAGEVEVTGGPAGTAPFEIESPWGPPIEVSPINIGLELGVGVGSKVLSEGSGRLVLTLTNLGDAPVDGSGTPVTIVNKLPQGIIAYGVEANAGSFDVFGSRDVPPTPVECSVGNNDVVCSYQGELPPYQAIEIEVLATLTGSPPAPGAPGEVTVSGGNASSASAMQSIKVTDEPVPFGIEKFSVVAEGEGAKEEGGEPTKRAGSHPF